MPDVVNSALLDDIVPAYGVPSDIVTLAVESSVPLVSLSGALTKLGESVIEMGIEQPGATIVIGTFTGGLVVAPISARGISARRRFTARPRS